MVSNECLVAGDGVQWSLVDVWACVCKDETTPVSEQKECAVVLSVLGVWEASAGEGTHPGKASP